MLERLGLAMFWFLVVWVLFIAASTVLTVFLLIYLDHRNCQLYGVC